MDLEFSPGFHLLLGDNAQGKTNILEAIYLLATLRSFRGVGSAQMVRHAQKGFFVGAEVEHATGQEIKIYWSPAERKVAIDANPVRRLSDFIGVFRAVVFCSEDIHLVKGPASRRRRYIDLLLAQTQPGYLALLQRYGRALKSRNALLKERSPDPTALEAFTHEVVTSGTALTSQRRELLPRITPVAAQAFQRITSGREELSIHYRSSIQIDFLTELRKGERRERALRTTIVGPHRDELILGLNGQPVAQFGSEGQKRSVAIALKMAQAEYLSTIHGSPPVLLIDDIMGELDAKRRAAFLPLLTRVERAKSQVFMTCTEENWPAELELRLQRWEVRAGKVMRAG